MRKDVKFAITIGAILIVTVAVYLTVLLRGSGSDSTAINSPTIHPDVKIAADNGGAPTDLAPPADKTVDTAPPIAAINVPATEPAASATSSWADALNRGVVPLAAAAPQQTVTPSVSGNGNNTVPTPLYAANPPALIDTPSTQPSVDISPVPINANAYTNSNTLTAPALQPRSHRVAPGESLWSISAAIYGNGKYADKIAAANPNIDPQRLKVGAMLTIPELTAAPASTPPAYTIAGNTDSSTVDSGTSYKVASGDTLERIAVRLYGDRSMMEKIYDLNKTLIGADENKLKIGWVLKLPQAPRGAAATPAADTTDAQAMH